MLVVGSRGDWKRDTYSLTLSSVAESFRRIYMLVLEFSLAVLSTYNVSSHVACKLASVQEAEVEVTMHNDVIVSINANRHW